MQKEEKYLIIFPTYNEKESLPVIIKQVRSLLKDVHILIVDDNSPDGTGEIADKFAKKDKKIFALHRAEKNGLGPAYIAGFEWAMDKNYDYVIEMDVDGSHRPEDLVKMLNVSYQSPETDLIIGSRWVAGGKTKNWALPRILLSKSGSFYSRLMIGLKTKDCTAGFRIYKKSIFKDKIIDLDKVDTKGFFFQVDMTSRVEKNNLGIIEVPILFVEREKGESKMSKKIVFEAFFTATKYGMKRFFNKDKDIKVEK